MRRWFRASLNRGAPAAHVGYDGPRRARVGDVSYTLDKSTGEQHSVELARPTRQECLTEGREIAVERKPDGY
jgi:hypothetical protein